MTKIRLSDIAIEAHAQEDYEGVMDVMDGALSEKGPWAVCIWDKADGDRVKVVLQSDDFTHDVALEINGHFRSIQQKIDYAELLAARMNRMPSE